MIKSGRLFNYGHFVTPYSIKESIGRIRRTIFGPKKTNTYRVNYISKNHQLNEITPKCTISFIGDIMAMNSKQLIIEHSVKQFIKGSDFLVGNFEGTITSEKKKLMDKRHKPLIMDSLENLFAPKKTFLSVANNHSGDFGLDRFSQSVEQLNKRGFNVFGTEKNPYIDLSDNIRVVGSTRWSNRPCNYLIELEDSNRYLKEGSFNILFPHWGYELELYPRIETVNHGRIILDKFDALIGHHSHCPQPISFFPIDNRNKLIAYSLGDFCLGSESKKREAMEYGVVIKAEVGTNPEGEWLIGKVEWNFLKSASLSKKKTVVKIVDIESNFFLSEPMK
ncbi:MAG: CapA family protein [Candidatus Hermodarchaeota archaeon]